METSQFQGAYSTSPQRYAPVTQRPQSRLAGMIRRRALGAAVVGPSLTGLFFLVGGAFFAERPFAHLFWCFVGLAPAGFTFLCAAGFFETSLGAVGWAVVLLGLLSAIGGGSISEALQSPWGAIGGALAVAPVGLFAVAAGGLLSEWLWSVAWMMLVLGFLPLCACSLVSDWPVYWQLALGALSIGPAQLLRSAALLQRVDNLQVPTLRGTLMVLMAVVVTVQSTGLLVAGLHGGEAEDCRGFCCLVATMALRQVWKRSILPWPTEPRRSAHLRFKQSIALEVLGALKWSLICAVAAAWCLDGSSVLSYVGLARLLASMLVLLIGSHQVELLQNATSLSPREPPPQAWELVEAFTEPLSAHGPGLGRWTAMTTLAQVGFYLEQAAAPLMETSPGLSGRQPQTEPPAAGGAAELYRSTVATAMDTAQATTSPAAPMATDMDGAAQRCDTWMDHGTGKPWAGDLPDAYSSRAPPSHQLLQLAVQIFSPPTFLVDGPTGPTGAPQGEAFPPDQRLQTAWGQQPAQAGQLPWGQQTSSATQVPQPAWGQQLNSSTQLPWDQQLRSPSWGQQLGPGGQLPWDQQMGPRDQRQMASSMRGQLGRGFLATGPSFNAAADQQFSQPFGAATPGSMMQAPFSDFTGATSLQQTGLNAAAPWSSVPLTSLPPGGLVGAVDPLTRLPAGGLGTFDQAASREVSQNLTGTVGRAPVAKGLFALYLQSGLEILRESTLRLLCLGAAPRRRGAAALMPEQLAAFGFRDSLFYLEALQIKATELLPLARISASGLSAWIRVSCGGPGLNLDMAGVVQREDALRKVIFELCGLLSAFERVWSLLGALGLSESKIVFMKECQSDVKKSLHQLLRAFEGKGLRLIKLPPEYSNLLARLSAHEG